MNSVAQDERHARYVAAYTSGDTPPWDSGIVPPEVQALVAGDTALSPGRALDVGCGTGLNTVFLAQHGWQVMGVDWVAEAVALAQQRAVQAGLTAEQAQFVLADAGEAKFLPGIAPVSLWLDIGCLHGLPDAARRHYAAHARRLVLPGGTLRLYAWRLHERDGQQQGIDPGGVADLFVPAFKVVDVVLGKDEAGVTRPAAWYTLRRL